MIWGSSGVKLVLIETHFVPISFDFNSINQETIAIVGVDILRAGTTLCFALHNGAKEVIPVTDSNEAMTIYNRLDKENVLLCGERNCTKIEGYHLDNSPYNFTSEFVQGKSLILDTTNGSSLFKKGVGVRNFFIGSFLNISLVCKVILDKLKIGSKNRVVLICSGNNLRFSFEDSIFCGCLIDLLIQGLAESEEIHLNDASVAALELYRLHRDNLLDFIKTTDHSKLLIQSGFERDIEFAVEFDKVSVVPVSNGFSFVSLK